MCRCEAYIEAGAYQLEPQQLEETLLYLSIRKTDSKFLKLNRLLKCLQGEYSAADFEQTGADDEETVRVKRKELRRLFIEQTYLERSSLRVYDINYGRDLPHRLSTYQHISVRRDLQPTPQQRAQARKRS